jgi:RNA polymerase sigma factor (sigma-70 family)
MSGDGRSELELFQALGQGDPTAFRELSARVGRCVRAVLNTMGQGRRLLGEVEDLSADAVERLERLRGRFRGGNAEFRSYLYKTVASRCVEATKRQQRTVSLETPIALPDGEEKPLGDLLKELVDPHLPALAQAEEKEERKRVRLALERLSERCRHLLWGFHVEGAPVKRLAEKEGARPNVIEVTLARCRERLYRAVLHTFLRESDGTLREAVTKVAGRLAGSMGEIFRAWWVEGRSPTQIASRLGLEPGQVRRELARGKIQVWRFLQEEGSP